MTRLELEDLVRQCFLCIEAKSNISLVGPKPRPKGFPRGELLCVNSSGESVYSYDPQKVVNYFSNLTYNIQE